MPYWIQRALSAPLLINDTDTYMVLIGGEPVDVVAGSLSMEFSVGRRAQASLTVRTATGITYQQYQQVLIYDADTTLIFAGYIVQPRTIKPGYQSVLYHDLTCCDQHYLADKRRVVASYINKTCGYIVQDIVTNVLSQEGVTVGMIYDGLTPSTTLFPSLTLYPGGNVGLIPAASFVYAKVSEALDELAKAASASGVPYYWMIDHLKRLWFVPYTTIVNSTPIDGSEASPEPPRIARENPNYRNKQTVLGGKAQTVQQTEIRKGDSNTKAWALGYELATVPTITVNAVAKTVGIKGIDTGKDFYWSKGDTVIAQDTAGVTLISTDTLQVVYYGQYPSVAISQNGAQVAYQASIDGTSGINEDVISDSTLVSASDGLAKSSQLLTRYAAQGTILTFLVRRSDIAPGQLITANLPAHGLSNTEMLVESVTASDGHDGLNLWYSVTAVSGPYDTTWVAFFSQLLKNPVTPDSIDIGVTQAVVVLQQFTATISETASLNTSVYACPLPDTALFPSLSLFPC